MASPGRNIIFQSSPHEGRRIRGGYTYFMQQATLRDMKNRSSTGNYLVHGTIGGSDCVVAFAFGHRLDKNTITPGLSNQQIAKYISELHIQLPKIMQFEIADAFPDTSQSIYRIVRHRKPGLYLDTREVAEQAKQIMDQHGWKKAIINAHPYHMPRADAVCQKLGIQTVALSGLGAIGFDPDSEQPWTRDAASCSANEANGIDQYVALNWI